MHDADFRDHEPAPPPVDGLPRPERPVELDAPGPDAASGGTVGGPASEPWHLEPMVRPRAGQCVGPYRLEREIGAGGMGVVFEAVQEDPNRVVAVKLIHLVGLAGEKRRTEPALHLVTQRDGLGTPPA